MFKYLITDLHQGTIVGTDDRETADQFSYSEDHFVADTEAGKMIVEGVYVDIRRI